MIKIGEDIWRCWICSAEENKEIVRMPKCERRVKR